MSCELWVLEDPPHQLSNQKSNTCLKNRFGIRFPAITSHYLVETTRTTSVASSPPRQHNTAAGALASSAIPSAAPPGKLKHLNLVAMAARAWLRPYCSLGLITLVLLMVLKLGWTEVTDMAITDMAKVSEQCKQ